ncbi:MAG TPA: 2-oxoglutarate dehydrogenase, E2 component, dihydrolipoamide succinyltransferase [Streptosporangiaceae bacterium]|nr:2-oxoglutarate dehydrogenase, E2 component, dihydrolipoamide succinyltransferase [Streptosporangiaceae bacterium]
MAVSVSMPQLGESVSEGTVTRWLKKEGERVERDEPLLEISTDKVDTEIPSPAAGILRSIAVAEDETVAVGAELATIDEGDDASQAAPAPAAPAPAQAAAPAQAPAPPAAPAPAQQETPQAQAPAPPAPPAQAGPPQPPAAPAAQQQPQPQTAPYQPPVRQAPQAPAPPAPPAAPVQAQPPAQVQQPPAQQPPAQQPTPSATSQALPSGPDGPYVTPLVRKLASEHEVDLAEVSGTGVGGRIRKQDVLDAARARREAASTAQQQPAPGPGFATGGAAPAPAPRLDVVPSSLRGTTERISRLRQVIAQRMVESLQTSAQLTTVAEADVTGIARLRERAKADFEAREGVRLSFLPFFALATVEALKIHPKLNAVLDTQAGQVTYHDAEHLGVAVDTDRGLLVPVIRNAGDLNIGGLARKIADLAQRTRNGQVSPDELAGGTFTLTNTGSRGALFDTPIINQPQVAILGTGTVVKRPVVVEDPTLGEVIAVRSMVYLALTYDHRLIDGADAARFLATVRNRLEEGAFEAELGL